MFKFDEKTMDTIASGMALMEKLEARLMMFSFGIIIMSTIDLLLGVIAAFYATITLIATIATGLSLTVVLIGCKAVQVSKIKSLKKSLRAIGFFSATWHARKMKKYFNKKGEIKMTKWTKLQKVLIAVAGALGTIGGAMLACTHLANIGGIVVEVSGLISTGLAAVAGIVCGCTSDHVLTDEEIAEVKEADAIAKLAEAEKILAAETEHAAKLEEAKKIVEELKIKTEDLPQ